MNYRTSTHVAKTLKLALILSAPCFPSFAFGNISIEIQCFRSFERNEIKLEFRTFYEIESRWSGGYVKYSTSQEAIPIFLMLAKSTPTSDSSPDDTTSKWLEIKNGKITGSYEASSQGARTYNFIYENFENKEHINLIQDPNTDYSIESGCEWDKSE
ncbi:hypothetical protein N5J43_29790 [Pseudomonas nicosulfuronedens]|uniref:hypothetical protein n=1 Tax=Pseudomonas nicosulfuronedens TaxID=2571105 RepID=UPI00244C3E0C|nr:hypothetical protein [Pseudomonas nicosulfuronedens]MDH1013061.1 hypothetical protein [Pseudomonas nicosulfuronedens]MDH1983168.1 hypothetical protein [Pseudomonas nicosulfuronedens]MDH2030795.1 hypothetical protein [Pseudomonas nicosulfuronedens]